MSFDLYVWGVPQPVTAEQAERICVELAEENTGSVRADAGVRDFLQELLVRFPALESLSDEEVVASPWSVTPWSSDSHVIMAIT